MNKNLFFFKILVSSLLSISIIFLSLNNIIWINFWSFLNIPASTIPFSDLDALNIFLSYKQDGFNPYFENPNSHPVHKFLIYPSIWLYIAEFLNLQNYKNFILFCFVILTIYFWIIFDLTLKAKNKKLYCLILIYFFSTSNFLLIERLNIEIIIFCLIYFAIYSRKIILKNLLFILSFVLKLFPIFSLIIFIDKKKNFFFILVFCLIYVSLFQEEFILISKNIIEYALVYAYGVTSISKGIYHYSMKYEYLINDDNYTIFKFILIILFSIYGLLIFLINFNVKSKKSITAKLLSDQEKLFLAGAGIFTGTYLISSNIDYRLVFLILTFPYLAINLKKNFFLFYCLILIISFNSLIFQVDDVYGLIFFVNSVLVYFFKIIIFSVNCFYLGAIIDKYIILRFNN